MSIVLFGSDAVLRWNLPPGATASDALRGHVARLPVGAGGAREERLLNGSANNSLEDFDLPTPGDSFWYLVRGENFCGNGPYGFEEQHGVSATARQSATCP